MSRASSATRVRTAIAWGANGQPRTYRLAPARHAAYRRLALAILGLDVATLAHELSAARRHVLTTIAA